MWFLRMHELANALFSRGNVLAMLITAGVAVFVLCGVGCATAPCPEKDDVFQDQTL
jgi:hypothetical protein